MKELFNKEQLEEMKTRQFNRLAKEYNISIVGVSKEVVIETILLAQLIEVVDEVEVVSEEVKEAKPVLYHLDADDRLIVPIVKEKAKANTEANRVAGKVVGSEISPLVIEHMPVINAMTQRGDQIRYLLEVGINKSLIAKTLNTHYSYVHTVAKTWELKSGHVAANTKNTGDSISQQIRDLHDAGWERSAICKKLEKEYSFVHNVIKAYKQKGGQ